jgi:heterotetrameric sarcosine oxidase delta subunit
MRINCPCCGERSLDEFTYYGDASLTRPEPLAPDAMRNFVDYVYSRTNERGPHDELWYHGAGCHLWLVVTRNVATHEILNVRPARDVARSRIRKLEAIQS